MKLTKKNYYGKNANRNYMSYSQFKDFCKCPAMAMAKIKGEYKQPMTDSLLVGSYVDSWLDGPRAFELFKAEHPEILNSRTGELKANFRQAEEICQMIKKDKYLRKLLAGRRQKIFTCNILGVPFKAKLDSLHPDKIVDGKVLRDCQDAWIDGDKKPFIYINRYDLQAAIYQTAVEQNTGKKLPFYLAVTTKETVPDKRVFKISDEVIEEALQEIMRKAPTFQAMKEGKIPVPRCGHCDYCKSIKKLSEQDIEEI